MGVYQRGADAVMKKLLYICMTLMVVCLFTGTALAAATAEKTPRRVAVMVPQSLAAGRRFATAPGNVTSNNPAKTVKAARRALME